MAGRPKNENRELALLWGDKTYRGSSHGCGTNERYTIGGGCVHCARVKALAQREALIEKQQAAADADAGALDSDSSAAYEAGIDDLM